MAKKVNNKFKVGDEVIVTRKGTSGHGFSVGQICYVSSVSHGSIYLKTNKYDNYWGYTVYPNEIRLTSEKVSVRKDKNGLTADDKETIEMLVNQYFDRIECDRSTNSCGIKELENVGDIKETLLDGNAIESKFHKFVIAGIKKRFNSEIKCIAGKNGAFATISLPKEGNKEAIAMCNKIPGVITTPWRRNPNSGSTIKMWIFKI